jgi:two-component system response regulator AtoC
MTAHGTVDTAVEAMKNGAFDYLVKPYNVAELRIILERAFQLRKLRDEVTALRTEVQDKYRLGNIVGTSPVMQEVYKKVGRVAQTNATVLITGESGSGKELVAKIIHNNSLRRDGPFVKVNCGALPEGLLESELFGYEKGAFTGAVARKPGRFELADQGTIFFDEIGELSLALQVKLLGVLQEREFERVGGTETIKVDVRIIAATNRDLEAMVRNGLFREDLYYRLKVVPIHVPPLRERTEDIPLLIEYFLARFAAEAHREPPIITAEAVQLLRRYQWPGNVRELANVLERAVIMSSGVIGSQDLPGLATDSLPPRVVIPETGTLRDIMHQVEKQVIARTLKACGGNRGKTAQVLDISRRALQYKIDEHGLGKAVLDGDQAAE